MTSSKNNIYVVQRKQSTSIFFVTQLRCLLGSQLATFKITETAAGPEAQSREGALRARKNGPATLSGGDINLPHQTSGPPALRHLPNPAPTG